MSDEKIKELQVNQLMNFSFNIVNQIETQDKLKKTENLIDFSFYIIQKIYNNKPNVIEPPKETEPSNGMITTYNKGFEKISENNYNIYEELDEDESTSVKGPNLRDKKYINTITFDKDGNKIKNKRKTSISSDSNTDNKEPIKSSQSLDPNLDNNGSPTHEPRLDVDMSENPSSTSDSNLDDDEYENSSPTPESITGTINLSPENR